MRQEIDTKLATIHSKRNARCAGMAAEKGQDHLAPPPVSRDDLDYHHTSDYVLDPNSPYSISPPPQRDEDRW